jgi:hypothetical protein
MENKLTSDQGNKSPSFFLITEDYVIGTPRVIGLSDRTLDIKFDEFASNHDLQTRLHLLSACLDFNRTNLKELVACYLSSFNNNQTEMELNENYLLNNGVVRILITNTKLKESIAEKYKF